MIKIKNKGESIDMYFLNFILIYIAFTTKNVFYEIMSQHKSFKSTGGSIFNVRNVLKRFERVELLKKRGEWKEGDRVVGLKKTLPDS